MKNEFDLLVVGGGFAGLISALVASKRGQKVCILTQGAGSLTIGGGVVDMLGYVGKNPIKDPFDAMESLPDTHPYRLLGVEKVREAVDFFKDFTKSCGYPYESNGRLNSWEPTALGNLKPTYLRPSGMDTDVVRDTKEIVIVNVEGLKDFYPRLMLKGLREQPGFKDKHYSVVTMRSPYESAKDLSAFDIAAYVTRPSGRAWLMDEFKRAIAPDSVVLMPPLLGVRPDMSLRQEIRQQMGVRCLEMSVMPPSVLGMRMRTMIIDELKKADTEIIEMAQVVRADVDGKVCKAVYTKAPDKERRYVADRFIIATGGFFGGGCVSAPGKAWEAVFNIDLHAPAEQEAWSAARLFGGDAHPFGSMGVKVNGGLQAVDDGGEPLLENVRFAGRTVGGYDFVAERSGNGVALATAYSAGL